MIRRDIGQAVIYPLSHSFALYLLAKRVYQNVFSNIEIKDIPAANAEIQMFHTRCFMRITSRNKKAIPTIKNTIKSCPSSIS